MFEIEILDQPRQKVCEKWPAGFRKTVLFNEIKIIDTQSVYERS